MERLFFAASPKFFHHDPRVGVIPVLARVDKPINLTRLFFGQFSANEG
jgi:hypothetical protein